MNLNNIRTMNKLEVDGQPELDMLATLDADIGFLNNVTNWDNHRPLLYLGLCNTTGPIIEFGAGLGSTPFLRKWSNMSGRNFTSYDSDIEWAARASAIHVKSWDEQVYENCGLCFIDSAPGEERHVIARRMKNMADIIVLHDTELRGAGNYMWDKIWHLFKYKLHYNRTGGGAGASMVSNNFDVSKYAGLTLGTFKFEAHEAL